MSENILRIIPTAPGFRPANDAARALVDRVRQIAPDARDVEIVDSSDVTFVDAGTNFETVSCSVCGVNLDLDWWGEQMSVAWDTRFEELDVVTPCCNSTCSLNDLDYHWPQGFARWYVTVHDPNRGPLNQSELDSLRSALGHELRVIWTHI